MKRQPSLIFCILMDLVGYASYAIPGLAEFADILWAPISSVIFMATFGGFKGVIGGFGIITRYRLHTELYNHVVYSKYAKEEHSYIDQNNRAIIIYLNSPLSTSWIKFMTPSINTF